MTDWLAAVALVVPLPAAAADTPGYPGPGEYRIDTDAVTSFGVGAGAMEHRSHIDGATGKVTSTVKAPGQVETTSVVDGGKPVTWCVKPATPSAAELARRSPFACQTSNATATSTDSSFSAACRSVSMQNTFQRIDAHTWEHAMTFEQRSDPDPMRPARDAMAAAMAHMTPGERAQAEREMASMPSKADMDQMRADMRRDLEEEVRTATPETAAAARQALAAIQPAPGGAVLRTTRVRERWTWIAATCAGSH